ncbi:MAG: hypothetical protein IJB00_05300 [Akkermansia sp.]|nr:hypothetical protein [Akkermansia sp.]
MKALKSTLILLPLLATAAMAETTAQQNETKQNPEPKQEIVDPSLASSQQQTADPNATAATEGENTVIPQDQLEETTGNAIGVLLDVNVGTLGAGFSVGYEFNKYLKARVRAGFLSYDHDDTWSDVDVMGEFTGNNVGIMLDYHPFGGRFRLTAGLTISDLAVDVEGSMDRRMIAEHVGKTYEFGGYQFIIKDEDVTAKAEYKWNKVQPYLGIGWSSDGEGDAEVYFTFDLGVNFMGTGDLSVSYTGGADVIDPSGNKIEISNQVLENAIREEGKDFFDIADDICVYPVIQMGIGVRF